MLPVQKRWFLEPTVTCIVVSVVMVATFAMFRQDVRFATEKEWYWRMKAEWKNAGDCIAAGDSQVLRGFDPEVFERHGLCKRGLNYGFSAQGYSREYLQRIEAVFEETPGKHILFLGISPKSISKGGLKRNTIVLAMQYSSNALLPVEFEQLMETPNYLLGHIEIDYLYDKIFHPNRPPRRATENELTGWWRSNGFVSTASRNTNPNDEGSYARGKKQIEIQTSGGANSISNEGVKQLCDWVQKMVQSGVVVVAYRPPMEPRIQKAIGEKLGFDEDKIATSLTSSGALWFYADPTKYATYDGLHLGGRAATALSEDLAQFVRDQLSSGTRTARREN